MITEAMFVRTAEILEAGLADAVAQGWGREARAVLAPVRASLTHTADEARATITDQMRVVAADPIAARGLYIEEILQRAMDALTTDADREAHARWEAALLADMRSFLYPPTTPAVEPDPAAVLVGALF
ncbi:hypothetical protein ABZ671_18740 [Micromonospora sp. NPDC006766]|uniref:hypothetical protein n=1 Tax=Micromonospora sp. NPDC006766 TaxID=3154778 RepID=UPI0033F8264F